MKGDFALAEKGLANLESDLGAIETYLSKKKQLLQSKKFKAKISGYEKLLADLKGYAKSCRVKRSKPVKTQSIERITANKMTAATTLQQILDVVSVHAVNEIKAAEQAADGAEKEFRANDVQAQVALMKKWIAQADDMESESEEAEFRMTGAGCGSLGSPCARR